MKYQLYYYHDVWGNEEDGWFVNNQSILGTVDVGEEDDDEDVKDKLLDALEHFGFDIGHIVHVGIYMDRQSSDEQIEFNIGEHDMPFAALVKVEE